MKIEGLEFNYQGLLQQTSGQATLKTFRDCLSERLITRDIEKNLSIASTGSGISGLTALWSLKENGT
jgi:hypothetical protein